MARSQGRAPTPPDGVPTWEEIAEHHFGYMYAVAFRLAGNHSEAQDVVQESLIRVQRGLATYTPGSLNAWLARIVTNVFLDDTRKRARRPQTELPDDPDRVIAGAPGADEALEMATLPDHLQRALMNLPEEFRVAVVLCDVAGLSYGEIGERVGVPVGTVRSRVSRGRRRLREELS